MLLAALLAVTSTACAADSESAAAGHAAPSLPAPPAMRLLLITGQNNHNWPFTSRIHKETLEASGLFTVDVTEQPETFLLDADALKKYSAFVLDFNTTPSSPDWDQAARKNFQQAVKGGTGVVSIHAANNPFRGWSEYEQMIGLMWRDGTGHGKVHEFDIQILDGEHPITKGLSPFVRHPDELYHNLANPQLTSPHLLMAAHSSKESGGNGATEPVAFTLQFGKGRSFVTTLGHVWVGDQASKRSVLDPQFRALIQRGAEWAATGGVTLPAEFTDTRAHNTLTAAETAEGWKLLFDGSSTPQFVGFKRDAFPDKGWAVRDGALIHEAQGGGGDIVTKDEYADFEFACEWKVAKGGNSGIMYRCDQAHNYPWETGREMQILDDENHADGKKPKTRAGTMYDLFACNGDVTRPWGEWNRARIVCRGPHIEHWLNDVKVVDVDVTSDEYTSAHAASKFPAMKDFGKPGKGVIALQDHGDEVWFRNIKVRELR